MKINRFLLAGIVFALGCLFLPGLAAAIDNFRLEISWAVPASSEAMVDSFTLQIDGQDHFTGLPVAETVTDDFTLQTDGWNYTLIFNDDFAVGDHTWQIIGEDTDSSALFQTEVTNFYVDSLSFWTQTLTPDQMISFGKSFLAIIVASLRWVAIIILVTGFLVALYLDIWLNFLTFVLVKREGRSTNRAGYVFDSRSQQGISFALLTLDGRTLEGEKIIQTEVADVYGFYAGFHVPRGRYRLVVTRPGFSFPSRHHKDGLFLNRDFYRGATFITTGSSTLIDPLVPMDELAYDVHSDKNNRESPRYRTLARWQQLNHAQRSIETFLFVGSVVALVIWRQWFLLLPVFYYGYRTGYQLFVFWRTPRLSGKVVDATGRPLAGSLVEVYRYDQVNRFEAVDITDKSGRFHVRLKAGDYRIRAKKNGYLANNQARPVNDDHTVSIDKKSRRIELKLIAVPTLSENFLTVNPPHARVSELRRVLQTNSGYDVPVDDQD